MNSAARRFPRLAPAIAATVLIAGAVFATPYGAAARTTPTPDPSSTPSVSTGSEAGNEAAETDAAAPGVSLALSPADSGVFRNGSDLAFTVEIANPGDEEIAEGTITIGLQTSALTSSDGYTAWVGDTGATGADSVPASGALATVLTVPTAALPARGSHSVQVAVPAAAVPFVDWGVYGAQATLSVQGTAVAGTRTTVVWGDPDAAPASPADVTVVAPITTAASTSGLIPSTSLEALTGDSGSLTRELDAVIDRPVTLAVDPRIIVSIRALGSTAPASAVAWLERLDQASNPIIPLGFGDSDLSGERQAGAAQVLEPISFAYALDPADFTDVDELIEPTASPAPATPAPTSAVGGAGADTDAAANTTADSSTGETDPGETESPAEPIAPTGTAEPTPTPTPTAPATVPTLDQLTDWDWTSTAIAWPRSGTVSGDDLGFFADSGLDTTIVDSQQLVAEGDDSGGAPLSASTTSSGHRVLVTDHGVSQAMQDALAAGTETRRGEAVSQLAGALAVTASQAGSRGDPSAFSVLAVLDRDAMNLVDVDPVLSALDALPWARTASLDALLGQPSNQAVSVVDAPQSAERVDQLSALIADDERIGAFSSILTDPAQLAGEYRARVLALLSNAWVANPGGWSVGVEATHAETVTTLDAVQMVDGSSINMVANQANLPVTVSNELPYPVTVVLHVTPSNGRLVVEQSDVEVTIEASSRKGAQIPLEAGVANGSVLLNVQVKSPTGVLVSVPAPIAVNVSADWETWGTVIAAVLLVLLFGAGLARNILGRRKARRAVENSEEQA
ncbi:MAG: DUF6049 family protein [Herbiconiux sp.]|nr:DUF6049 family protein [Herbiconiux sp.]